MSSPDSVSVAAPARVAAIQQRMAQLRIGDSRSSSGGNPLGFGLMLEQQRMAGETASLYTDLASAGSGLSTSNQTGLTPADQRVPGAYGPLTPPVELTRFGNGKVPSSALQPVGETGHRLWAPAASGLTALMADAAADGVTIGITDSYRPIDVQERLAQEKGLYSQGGLAAVPGTSNHGWGVATDLDLDDRALDWMRKNAWQYGFVEDVPREPWHWTYRPQS